MNFKIWLAVAAAFCAHAVEPARDLPNRIAAVSARFLGAPYKNGPLGEGPSGEFDRDPIARYDAFDCTTLIETTMALALESDPKKAEALLQKIRYKNGVMDYVHRNHFISVDWLPNNAKAGYIKDITRTVAGAKTKTASKIISKKAWYASKQEKDLDGFEKASAEDKAAALNRWRKLGENMPDEKAALDYLPIEDLPALVSKIPNGTIANLVRADQPDKVDLISHQLLIVDKDGQKYVRHAAYGKDVRDVPALEYFSRYAHSTWPLLGLNLSAVVQP